MDIFLDHTYRSNTFFLVSAQSPLHAYIVINPATHSPIDEHLDGLRYSCYYCEQCCNTYSCLHICVYFLYYFL